MTQRLKQPTFGQQPVKTSLESPKGRSGELNSQLRGMSFDEGAELLSPKETTTDSGDKGGTRMPAPGLKSRLSNSSYKRVYDLEKKVGKAKGGKRTKLVSQLVERARAYLTTHKEGRSKKQDERVKAVRALLLQLTRGEVVETPKREETSPIVSTTTSKPKLDPPKLLSEEQGTEVSKTETTPTETPTVEVVEDTKLPSEVTDQNVTQVLGELELPLVDLTSPKEETQGDKKVEVVEDEKKGGDDKVDKEEKPKIPEAPPLPSMNFGKLPNGVTADQLADASVQLAPADVAKLDYRQLIHYFDTRDKGHVESLRTEGAVVDRIMSFGAEQMANLVVRVILRTPDTVVDRGGARAEAIRVLSSQLRAKYIAKKLLTGDVLVVIVPKNQLMTDLPEFQSSRGKYTFDGRPWDTTRGLGGKNTAITEENLLGEEIATGGGMSRKGWKNQKDYQEDTKNKTDTKKTQDFNPDVYCSGYSTTNHEFFHTIHQFGLAKADSQQIQRLYDAKKKQPNATEWADGPRLDKSGNASENYSSSTVFEYFAQTGCAYQGTNKGTDPYTSRPRNNGRAWVERNEPELATLYARTCANEELKNVNPRERTKALDNIKKGGVAKAGEQNATQKLNPRLFANRARLEKLLTPGKETPPGVLVENN